MNNDDFTTNPPQGIQATLDLLYLWNPDAAKELIERLEQEIVEGRKLLPLSELTAPIEEYDPCFYHSDICIAKRHMDVVPDEPTEEDWYILHCKIDDVTVDGTSVVNNGVAAINLTGKVDKTDSASVVYGTDEYGNQTTYPATSFGAVDDVQVNGVSVVENKIASVTVPTKTSDIQNDSDYQTGTDVGTTVSSAITTHNGASDAHSNLITPITQDITAIEGKIPAQASSENKLADKNFVNSSISTNTANFIGTFNSVADLEAYSGTLTNNDYAFVISTDTAGNTVYNRYKYTTATTPASWQFEYALNNSSFTAEQWAAINSGATTTNIGQIATNTSTISGHIANTSNPHSVTKAQVGLGNVDNTSDANKPISTATQTALDGKANTGLSNLTSTGKNIGNWSTNISNCLIEVPNNIKMRVENDTLYVDSGCTLTKPNGETVVVQSGWSTNYFASASGQRMLFFNNTNNPSVGQSPLVSNVMVGTSDNRPAWDVSLAGTVYFSTDTQTFSVANSSSWVGAGLCMPAAVITLENHKPVSLDYVFNGFGFMGLTLFALPGVKYAIPNGRNADGTLNSTIVTLSELSLAGELGQWAERDIMLTTWSQKIGHMVVDGCTYNEVTNFNSYNGSNYPGIKIGRVKTTNGVITDYSVDTTPLHLVDYNDYADLKSDVETNTAAIATKQDAATALNYDNISNCIVEIPQNIAITVSSGSITLKSGSKVYIPNGSGVFTETTISSDLTNTGFSVGAIIITNGSAILGSSNVSSGTTAPENPVNGTIWYDTTNNIVKRYSTTSSSWVGGFSLPVGIVVSSTEVKLFNGFGYIGSTVFALPGVKGLIPNGRNTDGTLKNTQWTTNSVITRTFENNESFDTYIGVDASGFYRAATFNVEYNEKENVLYLGSNKWNCTLFATATLTSGVISNFASKAVFHAVDYSDFTTVANSKADKATTLSGYGITDAYTKTQADNLLNAKASTSLDNLTATGKNISNWSTNVSNCITEIPRDINLELNNRTLTLKAGSKVYVPNGAGVFDVVNITTDKTTTPTNNGVQIYFINESGNLQRWTLSDCFSGTTAPTSVHYPMWYDTTNNIIKSSSDYGSTWSGKFSFPICIITVSGGVISSIDQVFNGFGYIGTTAFVLPGVQALLAKGKNTNGTLKSQVWTNSSVKTVDISTGAYVLYQEYNNTVGRTSTIYEVNSYNDIPKPFSDWTRWYVRDENLWYASYAGPITNESQIPFVNYKITNGAVSEFNVLKQPFRAVDYGDTEFVAHQAAPSSRYTSLSLPASGGSITAPADGFVYINKVASAAGEYIVFGTSGAYELNRTASVANESIRMLFYVRKGATVGVNYTLAGATNSFRFIYANGVK